ncbi:hypothetical protein LCGC14_2702850, partial [marine sediment metagenome]
EFIGHCSNLQVWYEHDYDSRLLHRNLAFPLLKQLTEIGDHLAKRAFREEIAKRLNSGYPSVVNYLIEEKYIDYLGRDELLFNLLIHEEAEVIRELEQLSNIKFEKSIQFEILYDFEEYKRNSIVIKNKHVIRLDMYKVNLRQFPEIITQLSYLKELFLRKLRLKSISENIGELNSLERVDFSYNIIEKLPDSIRNLQNLKKLYLENNRLYFLPQALGDLKNLQELNIIDNKISTIPETFIGLLSLEELWMRGNYFEKFPVVLENLKNLKYLSLSVENVPKVPPKMENNKNLSIRFYS